MHSFFNLSLVVAREAEVMEDLLLREHERREEAGDGLLQPRLRCGEVAAEDVDLPGVPERPRVPLERIRMDGPSPICFSRFRQILAKSSLFFCIQDCIFQYFFQKYEFTKFWQFL